MTCIDEFYSNYGQSTYSFKSSYSSSYSTTSSNSYGTSSYEKTMQTYLCLSTICSTSGISAGCSNGTRCMSRTEAIELPSQWTNKGIF